MNDVLEGEGIDGTAEDARLFEDEAAIGVSSNDISASAFGASMKLVSFKSAGTSE
jgi:hypothetical protein